MSQSGGPDLKNVVCHMPGRDASLRRMYASHGVPIEASADSRSEKFAITIAQRQRTKCVWRSKNSYIVIDVRGLEDKDSPTFSKMFRNGTSFQQILVSVENELGAQSTPHTYKRHMEFHQGEVQNISSKQ